MCCCCECFKKLDLDSISFSYRPILKNAHTILLWLPSFQEPPRLDLIGQVYIKPNEQLEQIVAYIPKIKKRKQ